MEPRRGKAQETKLTLELLRQLLRRDAKLEASLKQDLRIKTFAAGFLAAVALVLTILNIVKGYTIMTIATGILVAGFTSAAIIVGKYKNRHMAMMIMAFMVMFMFTFFAVGAKNEGFAILWIMLVPLLSSYILNARMGLLLSCYFELLLIIMFYTPCRNFFEGSYSETFMIRFPILYLATLVASYVMILHREIYASRVERMAYYDGFTGLANRRKYEEVINEIAEVDRIAASEGKKSPYADVSVIVIDVNGLKAINDSVGHDAGDELIRGAASCVSRSFLKSIVVARTGGDEFCVITDADEETLREQFDNCNIYMKAWKGEYSHNLSMSFGRASGKDYPDESIRTLVKLADNDMYKNKAAYYNTSEHDRRRR